MRPSRNAARTEAKNARLRRELTQTQLADLVGAKQPQISAFEAGRIGALSEQKIRALFTELGLDPEAYDLSDPSPAVRRYCSEQKCRSHEPFLDVPVTGQDGTEPQILLLPTTAPRTEEHCRMCGHSLEHGCRSCGAEIRSGFCCAACGTHYVLPYGEEDGDLSQILADLRLRHQSERSPSLGLSRIRLVEEELGA